MDESLKGQLLIAAPQLVDYFRRTVVLVVEHTDEGAMGLVLNRPTETEVAAAVPDLAELTGRDDVVHAGGPVQPDAVVALGDFEELAEAGTPVAGTLGLLDPGRPDPVLRRLRVYAGYAGWAPGQLDGEIEEGAWIAEPATPGGRPVSSTARSRRAPGSPSRPRRTTPSRGRTCGRPCSSERAGRFR